MSTQPTVVLNSKNSQQNTDVRVGVHDGLESWPWLEFLSKYYWLIIVLVGLIFTFEQAREHFLVPSSNQLMIVFSGEILFLVLLLGLIGLLIRMLLSALAEKSRALKILRVKHNFIQQLSASEDIPEVSKSLIEQIALITPLANIELYIHEQDKDWFIRTDHLEQDDKHHDQAVLPGGISSYPCKDCLIKNNTTIHRLEACKREDRQLQKDDQIGFCLPLVYGNSPIGLLLLYLPKDKNLNAQQIDLLEHLSEEMALVVGMVFEKKAREDARLSERIHSMQMDIARDLHDTVGQNIGYLRMKLDHLSEKEHGAQTELVMEIRSMSRVANESYDLVRGTLAMLQAENSADLQYLFSHYAAQLAERADFSVDFSSAGTPRVLSAIKMRHLFYIFREALSNIEKHANASQVHVEITWDKNITLLISDNGKGYDLSSTQRVELHYGLKFMRERAALLSGSFSIQSNVGKGTVISVSVPCD